MKWVFLIAFGLPGLAFLIGGGLLGSKRYELSKSGVQTTGVVVDHFERISTHQEMDPENPGMVKREWTTTAYYPIVEFKTDQGETIRFQGDQGTSIESHPINSEVRVIYRPGNPQEAQILVFKQFWLRPLLMGGIGAFLCLMGFVSFVFISSGDKEMDRATRWMLGNDPNAVRIEARISDIQRVQPDSEQYVFVFTGHVPGAPTSRSFQSDHLDYRPGDELIGRTVTIYLDANDQARYFVDLAPLRPEMVPAQQR